MNSPSSDANRETEITLYNPSSEEAEELNPSSADRTVLDLEIDQELAERLLEVSKHLGLNPSLVASRAIDLVCEEIGTLDEDWGDDEDDLGTVTLIQRYQARIDLLQALKEESGEVPGIKSKPVSQKQSDPTSDAGSAASEKGDPLWEAVGEIKDVVEEEDDREDADDDQQSPAEDTAFEDGTLESESPPSGRGEEEPGKSVEKSSRWSVITGLMDVFTGSGDADEAVGQDAEEGDSSRTAEGEGDASMEDPTVDETVVSNDSLKESEPSDAEEEGTRSKDWDAVETIIETGEQAKE